MFGFSVDASETPHISARCLVSAEGRSVRKSQTCPESYLLLAGSSEAYLLLAGSSVKLIFIGWLLLRTACKLCRAEMEGALPGWLGPTQIAVSPVWEKHMTLFPPSGQKDRWTESLLPLLTSSSFYLIIGHCFDLTTLLLLIDWFVLQHTNISASFLFPMKIHIVFIKSKRD